MWLGKLAIISYLFSIGMIGVGFLLSTALGWDLFSNATQGAIDTLIGDYETTIEEQSSDDSSASLIFGNFIAGVRAVATLIFNVPTGGAIADLIGGIPIFSADSQGCTPDPISGLCGVGQGVYYIIRIFISFAGVALILNFIANREI
jgi:hypothetical protein